MSERQRAGWYDDPDAPGYVRWWDGARWADMRMPQALAPKAPSRADVVFETMGNVGKIILLLALLALLLFIGYAIFLT
jgi:hypothetical protein